MSLFTIDLPPESGRWETTVDVPDGWVLVRRDIVRVAVETYPESGLDNVTVWYRRRCDALDLLRVALEETEP